MREHAGRVALITACLQFTWRGEGLGVALVEAAGEVLQHALSLLRLSDQHHHFKERPGRASASERTDLNTDNKIFYGQTETVGTRSAPRSPQGTIQSLSREVEEFEVLLPDGATEVITETQTPDP